MTSSGSTTVRCRTLDGVSHTLTMTVVSDEPTTGILPARIVAVDHGPMLLQKWVPRTPAGRPGLLDPLDREIQALHNFAMAFPPDAYPLELPRLRYYDVDSEEPFALLEPYRGVPVANVLPRLSALDRYRVQVGLLQALHLTGMAGMTHGRVALDVLLWDAQTRSVQLVGFERATRFGEHTMANGGARAHIRDDMWDAGLAIWRTAHPEHAGSEAPDITTDGGALRVLLDGVFIASTDRATPRDLLARLREPVQPPDAVGVLSSGATSRRAFEVALRRKRERRTETEVPRNPTGSILARVTRLQRGHQGSPTVVSEPEKLVRCPICLDAYSPPDDGLWRRGDDGEYHEIPASADPLKKNFNQLHAYRKCPNPSQDSGAHYLPANYCAYDEPLVVALVGQSTTGKTHLLAAMMRDIVERDGLAPYGISVVPMDLHRHDDYRTAILEPVRCGVRLPCTPGKLTDPANILLMTGQHGSRPLVFFDVAGEDLAAVGDGKLARFLLGVNALMFVHGLEPAPDQQDNRALGMTLARLRAIPHLERVPAAIVATKSDRLRYQPPVSRWLRQDHDPLASVDPNLMLWESSDVYAFLHDRQEHGVLAPFCVFDRCTLHFVSASGSEVAPDKDEFPRGFAPSRVLQPLVAILAMAGVLDGDQMRLVGA